MNVKRHIPNLLTLGNLFSGTVASIFAVQGDYILAAFLVSLGIFFDFFDGFAARLLNVSGELGKQLDSLADMVTSGVVPGIIMYKLLIEANIVNFSIPTYVPFLRLLLTLGACYRLANFNIDTRQSDSFIGLPTPAMSLFIVSLPLIQEYSKITVAKALIENTYFLLGTTLALTYVMNAEIILFSLKFKEYSIKNNVVKYLFLILSVVMIVSLHYLSIPLIIVVYLVLSLMNNKTIRK